MVLVLKHLSLTHVNPKVYFVQQIIHFKAHLVSFCFSLSLCYEQNTSFSFTAVFEHGE